VIIADLRLPIADCLDPLRGNLIASFLGSKECGREWELWFGIYDKNRQSAIQNGQLEV